MAVDKLCALAIRADAAFDDLIGLLSRMGIVGMDRWLGAAIELLEDAEAFRKAVADETQAMVDRGFVSSPSLRLLATIRVFGQWARRRRCSSRRSSSRLATTARPRRWT